MKRVLSLLLLIPFLVTQAWALRGGPYDSPLGGSQAVFSGTYGISLQGTEAAGVDSISTTGVLSLSVPLAGLVTGRILIFDKGLMYLGNTYGHMDSRSGKMRLLAQASHYAVLAAANTMYTPVVDYNLSGQVNLSLDVDYLSGLIVATGDATFARSEPLIENLVLTNTTATSNSTTTGATNDATGTSGNSTTSQGKTAGIVTKIETVTIETNPSTGETKTTTVTTTSGDTGPDTTTTSGSTSNETKGSSTTGVRTDLNMTHRSVPVVGATTVEGSNEIKLPTGSTSGLTTGMSVIGPGIPNGATIVKVVDGTTLQISKPATASAVNVALAANSGSVIFLTMTAEGIREDALVSPLPLFTPPTTTSFQIGVNQTGVAAGAGAGAGAGG